MMHNIMKLNQIAKVEAGYPFRGKIPEVEVFVLSE